MAAGYGHSFLICSQDKSELSPMTISENCWEVGHNMPFTEFKILNHSRLLLLLHHMEII